MELLSLTSLIFFLLFVFIFLETKEISKYAKSFSHIPGPKKLPLIGDLHLMLGNTIPHRLFRDLAAKYGPLMHLQLGEVHCVIVSSMEYARELATTHDLNFANRPRYVVAEVVLYNGSDVGFAPYGDYWRMVRKIFMLELLSAKRVRSFQPIREEENKKLVKWLAAREGSSVDLPKRVHTLTYDIISRIALGSKTMDRETVLSVLHDITKFATGFSIGDLYPSMKWLHWVTGNGFKLRRMRRQMDRAFDSIIEQHRVDKDDSGVEDMLDVLLKAQDQSESTITDENIKGMLMSIFFGASDTSPVVVEWAMSHMMKEPSILKKAQDEVRKTFDKLGCVVEEKIEELHYLTLVINEALRLHPPTPLLPPRMNEQKCELNGYEIPAKTTVTINAWALGRDPRYWGDDAEEFKPERFADKEMDYKGYNYEFIPFGLGRRSCPGALFGVANVAHTLAVLLFHFDWALPQGIANKDLDMTDVVGATVGRKHPLLLIPTLARPFKD